MLSALWAVQSNYSLTYSASLLPNALRQGCLDHSMISLTLYGNDIYGIACRTVILDFKSTWSPPLAVDLPHLEVHFL